VPPTIAFIAAIIIIKDWEVEDGRMGNLSRDSGATFCQVVKISAFDHEIDVITDGNQKCPGTAPSFRSKPKISIGTL
jgi:hypothetical protein